MNNDLYEELSEERKKLQANGLLPEWYSTGGYQLLKAKYLQEGETPKERYQTIAKAAASYLPNPSDWEDKFFDIMWKGWLSPSTPVLSNMGTEKGTPVSCSGGVVADNVYDFYEKQKEAAILSQNGFGTSSYLGDIRPRGTKISRGGTASGVLPVLKDFVQLSNDISQGNNRRGSWAGYLPIDHGDFWEVADYLYHYPDSVNIGWVMTKAFKKRLDKGDEDAIARYQRVMKIRSMLGKGYIWKEWTANEHSPEIFKSRDLPIKASNLCVAPETKVLTDAGYFQIEDICNQTVNVWNGVEFSEVVIRKTGDNQKLIKVVTNQGQDIECTPYHKFYIKNTYHGPIEEVRACDLKAGDKLIKFDLPIIEGSEELDRAYTNGFFSGDGCFYKGRNIIYLYGDKKKLLPYIEHNSNWSENPDRITIQNVVGLKEKFFVPDNTYTLESRLRWLEGLSDSDGTVARSGDNESLQISSIHKEFLFDVTLMLQTMGIRSVINKGREEGYNLLPKNDGSGEDRLYFCQQGWRLCVSSWEVWKLREMGFSPKRLDFKSTECPQRDAGRFNTIVDVIDEGRYDNTYCFSEPKRRMGMFNGVLTGQCVEINLPSNEELTFTCVLSSMNLYKYDEWKNTDAVFIATVFLDCVAEEFLQKAKKIKGLERAVAFTEKSRSLGLGVLGLHSLFQKRGIAFESFEAHQLNTEVFKHISEKSLKASQWMAKELGEPEWCVDFGVRNATRMAVAPTMSTSLVCGGLSQGIEPIVMNVYNQTTAGGEVYRISPELIKRMEERGVYNAEAIKDIERNAGSVQHVQWLTDEEKAIFKTAFEIDQRAILRLASTRQRYIDQSQSVNLFFDADEDEEYISEIIQEAINDEYLIGLYYQRSMSGVKATRGECSACEG